MSNKGIPRKVGKLMLIVIGQWKFSSCPQMSKEKQKMSAVSVSEFEGRLGVKRGTQGR